jgi:hypothetical protein
MKRIIILLLICTCVFAQRKIKYGDFTPQLKADLKDTTSRIISDSLQNFKNLGFSTPQDFADNPDTVGSGSAYDDTYEINQALAQKGLVYFPTGDYEFSAPWIVGSNTTLEFEEGAKFFFKANSDTYMVINENMFTGSYDSNIVMIGGYFDGNDANQTNGLWPNSMGHGLFMDSVKNVTLINTFWKDIKRFAGWISHYENVTLLNTGFDTEKDGFDFYAGKGLYIDGSYGHTGDDMHGLKIGDYQSMYQALGDITDVIIKNLQAYDIDTTDANAYGAQSMLIIAGGANSTGSGYRHRNIYISNFMGDVNTYPIRVISGPAGPTFWPSGTQYTYVEDIFIEKILTNTSAYPNVRFKPSFADKVTMSYIIPADSNISVSAVEMGDTASASIYTDVRLDNIHGNFATSALVIMEDSTVFVRPKFSNMSGANSPSNYLIWTTGGITIRESWDISDVKVDSMRLIQINTNVIIEDDVTININDFKTRDISAPISLKNSCNINLSNGFFDNTTYAYQVSGAGNTYRILGNGNTWVRKEPFGWQDGNCILSQNNPTIPIDVDIYLTPQDLDVVYSNSGSTTAPANAVVQYNTTDSLWHLYQNKYLMYDFSLNPPSIAASSGWDTTYIINPLSTIQDYIIVDMPYDLNDNFLWSERIDANNTVRIKLYNTSGGVINQAATIDSVRIFVYKKP